MARTGEIHVEVEGIRLEEREFCCVCVLGAAAALSHADYTDRAWKHGTRGEGEGREKKSNTEVLGHEGEISFTAVVSCKMNRVLLALRHFPLTSWHILHVIVRAGKWYFYPEFSSSYEVMKSFALNYALCHYSLVCWASAAEVLLFVFTFS